MGRVRSSIFEALELGGEVAKERGLAHDAEPSHAFSFGPKPFEDFQNVVHMGLGVDPAGHGEANELAIGGDFLPVHEAAEHDGADLHSPDAALLVQLTDERLGRETCRRDVRIEAFRVHVDGMTARRLDDLHPDSGQPLRKVANRRDPVFEVTLVEGFVEPDGEGFEVAPGEAASSSA